MIQVAELSQGAAMVRFVSETAAELTASVVRAELARRKISRQQFAEALGWSERATRRRLNGEKPLNIDELTRVATYLNVPVSALVHNAAA